MKNIKWKILTLTCLICLLPIFFGLYLWDKLPDVLAIHFDMYNRPDNFASKGFVVFGLPMLMAAFQFFCCVATDIGYKKRKINIKLERISKWIIPIMTVLLYGITLEYGLGRPIDIRKVAVSLVGCMFIVTGNYLPKLDYIKHYDIKPEKARKINRIMGFWTVILGIVFLISAFLPPAASIVALFLCVLYGIIGAIYGFLAGRNKGQE